MDLAALALSRRKHHDNSSALVSVAYGQESTSATQVVPCTAAPEAPEIVDGWAIFFLGKIENAG